MEKCSSMFPLTTFNPKVGIQEWLKGLQKYIRAPKTWLKTFIKNGYTTSFSKKCSMIIEGNHLVYDNHLTLFYFKIIKNNQNNARWI
jgi:hypothetical protein